MRPWLMGIGLTLAINGLTYAVSDAFGAPLALVTPEGFCEADGSHPADAKVTALFKKSLDTMLGAKLLSLYRFCPGSPTTSGLIGLWCDSTICHGGKL